MSCQTQYSYIVVVVQGGQWILELVDFFGGGFIVFILTIVETVAAVHLYGESLVLHTFCWAG